MDEAGEPTYNSTQLSIMVPLVSLFVLLVVLSYGWIIVTVARTHSLHTASNCFLTSLAFSIVIMGLVGIPSVIFFTAVKAYTYPLIFILTWVMFFCIIGFFLNAVLLAADKWFKISRPFLYIRVVTRSNGTVCLSVIWATTLLGSLIIAIVRTATVYNLTRASVNGAFAFMSVIIAYGIIMPSVTAITVLNIGILRIARQQARAILPNVQQQQQPRVENDQPPPQFAGQQRGMNTRSTRQFSIFFMSFPVTWFPTAIFLHALYVSGSTRDNDWLVAALMIFSSIILFHTAFGTLILTLLQREYRQILKKNTRIVLEKMHCIKRR
ncbi:beta-1 adrenergic receptor-like [Asterias rubens]|uniref:beta-1 adrenergic receptor-like n=1 Tax=Asterias rubens TaxID=7604 RepID=UPI0014556C49|nr:beta-1 adrenergic receptor-like [Asterias rubens]